MRSGATAAVGRALFLNGDGQNVATARVLVAFGMAE